MTTEDQTEFVSVPKRAPVRLTDCADPYEAAAIVGALEHEGITVVTDGELVGFNYVEVQNRPIVRVAEEDLGRAREVLAEWREEVAQRRAERISEQNSVDDPTSDDDVSQDRHGRDGVLWDRYGRTSIICNGFVVAALALGASAFLVQFVISMLERYRL